MWALVAQNGDKVSVLYYLKTEYEAVDVLALYCKSKQTSSADSWDSVPGYSTRFVQKGTGEVVWIEHMEFMTDKQRDKLVDEAVYAEIQRAKASNSQ